MLLNNRPTNPGQLRTKITLESATVTQDGSGGQAKSYTTVATVYAKWVNAHGPESIQDGAMQGPKRATVTIRYRTDINATWAITKGSERYQILTAPDDIQERHEYMEMQVQLMLGSA